MIAHQAGEPPTGMDVLAGKGCPESARRDTNHTPTMGLKKTH